MLEVASEALSQVAELIEIEFRLARTELGEKLNAFQAGLVLMIVGAVFLIGALLVLLQAIVLALVQAGLSPLLATLVVGIACLAVGAVLVAVGKNRTSPENLVPDRTLNQVARDGALAKEKLS
jgi:uncharacterized membrane protein YqjE